MISIGLNSTSAQHNLIKLGTKLTWFDWNFNQLYLN